MQIDEGLQTDSHLAKKYNDLLYDAMMRCNVSGFMLESEPHFTSLQGYVAAIHTLYRNTFMLFYNVSIGKDKERVNLAAILFEKMQIIRSTMREMKKNPKTVSREQFESVENECHVMHMLINDGLQSLKMLVRTSSAEPRGEQSVFYWNTKASFKKSNLREEPKKQVAEFLKGGDHYHRTKQLFFK